jgi:hypothetical protein
MGIFGASETTDGADKVVATGNHGTDEDGKKLQVAVDQDSGLEVGAVYKITFSDGTGFRGIVYTGNDGTLYDFAHGSATAFSPGAG